jgi:hypothetical protein
MAYGILCAITGNFHYETAISPIDIILGYLHLGTAIGLIIIQGNNILR